MTEWEREIVTWREAEREGENKTLSPLNVLAFYYLSLRRDD